MKSSTERRVPPTASRSNAHGEQVDTLVPWTPEEALSYGHRPVRARHELPRLDLFSENSLLDLLESYPRERLQAFTMGTNPLSRKDWRPVDTSGSTGRDLFAALRRARLWFNVLQVDQVDRRYRDLIDKLYQDLCLQCPGFSPSRMGCTLIMSSPGALVYYHADAQPNLLWQIRGTKRVWVYPAGDEQLIKQDLMEDIFASFADEEVPYQSAFDAKADTFDMNPGDVLSWPQNSPHRVTNLNDVNISLSTVHQTEASDRRKLIYCANRLFRRKYRLPLRSTKESGPVAYSKRFAYRTFRRAGLVETPPRRAYITDLRIDLGSPTAVRVIETGSVLTEFSQKDFRLQTDARGEYKAVQLSQMRAAADEV